MTTSRNTVAANAKGAASIALARYGPYVPWITLALLAVGVIVVGLDVLFAKSVFDVLVNENEAISWTLAFGVSGAGALAAVCAGIAAAEGYSVAKSVLLGIWCAIGVAMATTRCFKEVIDGNDFAPKDLVLAALMIGVYLGSAALFIHAREAWRPKLFELRSAGRQLRRAQKRKATCEGAYVGTQHEITDIANARKRNVHELDSQLRAIDAMQRRLHSVVRDHLVHGLADPAQTSLFRSDIEEGEKLPRDQASA